MEVIAARSSLAAAESIYTDITIEKFKLVDQGCHDIFSSLKEVNPSDFYLVKIAITSMPTRYGNRVSTEVKGFRINTCLLFAENLVRYLQDCDSLWALKQIAVAAKGIKSDIPDFLLIDCEFQKCEVLIPIDQAQRPTGAGILMKICDLHLQNHEL